MEAGPEVTSLAAAPLFFLHPAACPAETKEENATKAELPNGEIWAPWLLYQNRLGGEKVRPWALR